MYFSRKRTGKCNWMNDLHLCKSKQFPWSVTGNRSLSVKTLCTYPGSRVSLVWFQSIQNFMEFVWYFLHYRDQTPRNAQRPSDLSSRNRWTSWWRRWVPVNRSLSDASNLMNTKSHWYCLLLCYIMIKL